MSKKFFKENEIMNGSGGFAWLQGRRLATVQKAEAKVSGEFDPIKVCGDTATYAIYNGYSGEGTITFKKIDSEVLKLVAEGYQTGEMPDITIITAQKQRGTNKVERVAYHDVTIPEFKLADFGVDGITEEELPFKFGNFEVLETI